jgi:RimJ/RimL family protein N-acetyltransferase
MWLSGCTRLREQIDSLDAPTEAGNTRYWQEKWRDKTREDYAIVVGERHVGNCGLVAIDVRRRKAELWIYIGDGTGRSFGRQALGALLDRAFADLDLHRVSLRVVETNLRALTFYMRAGFKVEGRARADTIQNGISLDSILLSILAREYGARVTSHRPRRET